MDRNLQIIGIAKKAGLLAVGGEDVSAAAQKGKAKLIVCANDASEGAQRRARVNAETGGSLYIVAPYSKFEIGNMSRRGSPGTIAFLDSGLAAGFARGLSETDPDRYGTAAQQLTEAARALEERKKNMTPVKRRTAK